MKPSMTGNLGCCVASPSDIDTAVLISLEGWLFPLLRVWARLDGFHAFFDAIHASYLCIEKDKMYTVVGVSYCFSFLS